MITESCPPSGADDSIAIVAALLHFRDPVASSKQLAAMSGAPMTRPPHVFPALVVGLGLAGCITLLLYGDAPGSALRSAECRISSARRPLKHSLH